MMDEVNDMERAAATLAQLYTDSGDDVPYMRVYHHAHIFGLPPSAEVVVTVSIRHKRVDEMTRLFGGVLVADVRGV